MLQIKSHNKFKDYLLYMKTLNSARRIPQSLIRNIIKTINQNKKIKYSKIQILNLLIKALHHYVNEKTSNNWFNLMKTI